MTESDDALRRAEDLLARLEAARTRLESTEDPDQAIEILQELSELAKDAETEFQRAKRAAETEAATQPVNPDAPAD
jgi:exonuclease VII small subunit